MKQLLPILNPNDKNECVELEKKEDEEAKINIRKEIDGFKKKFQRY